MLRVSMAFEATADDVFAVLRNAGIEKSIDECEKLVELLDLADIEQAALYADDLDEQTEFAHQEIHDQLVHHGLIAPAPGPSLTI